MTGCVVGHVTAQLLCDWSCDCMDGCVTGHVTGHVTAWLLCVWSRDWSCCITSSSGGEIVSCE